MPMKFSPSINIERDFKSDLNYVATPNSKRIYEQIINNYRIGIRAFSIIGSYGTGKSAFIWALEKQLKKEKNFFGPLNGNLGDIDSFDFINIVGEYNSIIDTIAKKLKLEEYQTTADQILLYIKNKANSLNRNKKGLAIVIDEFGKLLEYAALNNPDKELYFIQQLAELANDTSQELLFIIILHQGFDSYASRLSSAQRQEWEKVKGRLKELTFNEPVEQLLYLAAESLTYKYFLKPENLETISLFHAIKKANVFPLQTEISIELAQKLYPLDLLSAAVLTLALQFYGQNERSLFTFLESDEYHGLSDFMESNEGQFFNLSNVYDYLINNFSTFLFSKFNPHFFQWRAILTAIDRVESSLSESIADGLKLIKTIGLLNIFAKAGAKLNNEFLSDYARFSLNIKYPEKILTELESKKIIRYLNFKNQYILFEGTDLNIDVELEKAASKIPSITNPIPLLKKYFDFPFLSAKGVQYKYGTPRFFRFEFSNEPIDIEPRGTTDGIINLIFSETQTVDKIIEKSKNVHKAIIYGVYHNIEKINEILFEIEKIKYVLENVVDDPVAERELKNMLEFHKQELDKFILNNLYQSSNNISWIFNGKKINIKSKSNFNQILSLICEKIYSKTPIFKNELINREKLPTTISRARKNLLEQLINYWDKSDLGFNEKEFPPEKTIYLALLKNTGIHRLDGNNFVLTEPLDSSFKPLWEISEDFLKSAVVTKKNLNEFIELLSSPPFKLKRGFIDFWIPVFLFIKRDEFALFGEDGFVPEINSEVLELIIKKPNKFQIKTFRLKGVRLDLFNKYRDFLNQQPEKQVTTESFIQTIKPFLAFYRSLPEYVKKTKRLSRSALNLREAIANATDPEKAFFEDFPHALGYSLQNLNQSEEILSEYVIQLKSCIRELRGCFGELLSRIERKLLKITGYEDLPFEIYRSELKRRYTTLKTDLLLPHQLTFYKQIQSELDERDAWIKAVVQSILHKPIEKMKDEEEEIIYYRLENLIHELDDLCEISEMDIDIRHEKVYKLELTPVKKEKQSKIYRFPKSIEAKTAKIKDRIKELLADHKDLKFAVLIELLEEEISNESTKKS